MNADWKVGKAQYAEFNVPTCGKFAVWLLCREAQPLWKSHDSWWPELMPWCSFPWHKLLPSLAQKTCCTVSLNLIHELTSLIHDRLNWKCFDAGSLMEGSFPLEACLCRHQCFSAVGQATAKIRPRRSPRVIFNWKNFIEQPILILKWMLIERWGRLSMLNSMCQHVARLQFDCCAEKHSLCGRVMIYDGLCFMPWCSFPWHKLLPSLAQKTCCTVSLNLIHELTSLFSPKVIFAGSLRKAFPRKHAFVDIKVFLWLGKQRPRFAQGQPKGYLQLKELHRTSMLIDRWGRLSMLNSTCQHVATLQFD